MTVFKVKAPMTKAWILWAQVTENSVNKKSMGSEPEFAYSELFPKFGRIKRELQTEKR